MLILLYTYHSSFHFFLHKLSLCLSPKLPALKRRSCSLQNPIFCDTIHIPPCKSNAFSKLCLSHTGFNTLYFYINFNIIFYHYIIQSIIKPLKTVYLKLGYNLLTIPKEKAISQRYSFLVYIEMFYSRPSKSSNFTEASFETPDSCIVTPYNTSASSIVPLL